MDAFNAAETPTTSEEKTPKLLLVGLPSTGKTTIGRLIAQRTGRPFFDTNEMIEAQTGLSPKCLIRRRGEAHFQALESAALQKALQTEGAIVAGGSGIVAVDANQPARTASSCGSAGPSSPSFHRRGGPYPSLRASPPFTTKTPCCITPGPAGLTTIKIRKKRPPRSSPIWACGKSPANPASDNQR